MTKNPLFYGVLLLVLAVFVTQCCFTVHQTQQALVLQLGDPLPEIYRPGLHFKLPFIQKVVYFDARVLDYAASSREAFTVDKKTIVLDNYARWRISDPLRFYRTMRTIPGAQARLDDVVYSQLRALVGAYTLTEADAVAEMRRSVPDFTAQEWQEYLLDGKLDFIYYHGQRLYHEDTCASLLKTQRALNARALAPYDEQKPRLEAVIRQVMAATTTE